MVTTVPTCPLDGEMLVMCAAGTVKLTLVLLLIPDSKTTTDPLFEDEGTVATICVSDQLETEATDPPI